MRSAAPALQPLRRGAGLSPATRPFRRWSARPTAAGSATLHRPLAACEITARERGIRTPGALREQYVHAIDLVPTVLDLPGHRAAPHDPRRDPVARRRGEHRPHSRRRRAPRPAPHPVLRDDRPPALSTTTAGGRCAPGRGPSFAEAGKGFGEPISAEKLSELDATGWSCTTWRRTSPRTTTWPPTSRPADRDDRDAGT